MGRVEGKVVVITGAARGQGRSHAVRLAEEGADIIAIDLCENIDIAEYPMGTAEDLEETARLVEKTGRRVVTRQVDVRDRAALETALAEGVAELGRIDVVVPNAGILPIGAGRPVTAFTETVDINLGGVLNTVHAAMPHTTERFSVIVIGSVTGLLPSPLDTTPAGPGFAGYRFAKKTLVNYVDSLAVQLAPSGSRVNAVHPTNVDTDMLFNDAVYRSFRPDLEAPTREDAEHGFHTIQPMPIAYVDTSDVTNAVVFLASDESRYVTGTHLKVDGGALAQKTL
ncbi:mycofactocin-coupled SDR family oxidoreductase (plasmid) [Streptomyces yangpuensis]|uniref:Mycofactocin-coupled SDR family oxidoreductase n=1 Tax=Streptomyces yangpuensis TaxID=1648182 RepID=A0ABY5Q8D8_9ACTN|nr:mycofactocin-coupled SDR family oxidoreductase [Streptomyces yangpuensis]UUY52500.1 mycofactocin-coupled SDR family oxidoreductase [Streptomyces yangpuensis]